MLDKAKFVHRVPSLQDFKYDKNSFDVVDLIWDFLLDDVVNFLTRTIRDSSTHESFIDLRDTIHAVVVIKTTKDVELFIVMNFLEHLSKKFLVFASVLCMD